VNEGDAGAVHRIGRALALAFRGDQELVFENPGAAAAADDAPTHDQALAPSDTQPPVLDRRGRMRGNWRTALVLVQPDTVVRWHRDWLRRRWKRRSKSRPDGRHRSISRSPYSSDGWRQRTRYGEPEFLANSARQASTLTSQNARSRAGLQRHPRPLADLSDFRCSTADPPSSSFPRPRS
jgi:hypothetical protein